MRTDFTLMQAVGLVEAGKGTAQRYSQLVSQATDSCGLYW